MSPVDAAIIRHKLQRIAASLEALRPLARLSIEEDRAPQRTPRRAPGS